MTFLEDVANLESVKKITPFLSQILEQIKVALKNHYQETIAKVEFDKAKLQT